MTPKLGKVELTEARHKMLQRMNAGEEVIAYARTWSFCWEDMSEPVSQKLLGKLEAEGLVRYEKRSSRFYITAKGRRALKESSR